MPDSTQDLEARTESRSNVEGDVPAISSAAATSGHEEATETSQTPVVFVKVARDSEGNPMPVPGPMIPRPTKSVECNMMRYTDDGGVTHEIYMPKGTASLASTLLTAKRYSDLAKFPAWDNQTYDDWEADEEKYGYLRDELGETPS